MQTNLEVKFSENIRAGSVGTVLIHANFNTTSISIAYQNRTLIETDINMFRDNYVHIDIPDEWLGRYEISIQFYTGSQIVISQNYNMTVLQKILISRGVGNYEIVWDGHNSTVETIFQKINYQYIFHRNKNDGSYEYISARSKRWQFQYILFNETYIYYEI